MQRQNTRYTTLSLYGFPHSVSVHVRQDIGFTPVAEDSVLEIYILHWEGLLMRANLIIPIRTPDFEIYSKTSNH